MGRRKIFWPLLIILLLAGALLLIGIQSGYFTGFFSAKDQNQTTVTGETIKIATWNIQNFGQKKAGEPEVMAAIAENLKGYDIIAVQEISNFYEKSDSTCPKIAGICPNHTSCGLIGSALEKYLNEENNLSYSFVFSDQARDERYLFIYDSSKVNLTMAQLVSDPEDTSYSCDQDPANIGKMTRQPFKAIFQKGNFTFTLLNAHTSPSRNQAELQGLEYFYRTEETAGSQNIIVLGDLNADCDYLYPNQYINFRDSKYTWAIPDGTDTTVSKNSCTYDRFIFNGETAKHFTGSYGVTRNTNSSVSDHYLVWAEFSSGEVPQRQNIDWNSWLGEAETFLFG